jgi:hypothetical protein
MFNASPTTTAVMHEKVEKRLRRALLSFDFDRRKIKTLDDCHLTSFDVFSRYSATRCHAAVVYQFATIVDSRCDKIECLFCEGGHRR